MKTKLQGLTVNVLRGDVDCTNNGITSKHNRVVLVLSPEAAELLAAKGERWGTVLVDEDTGEEIGEVTGEPTGRPVLRVDVGRKGYLTARPVGEAWADRWLMMGGNFVYSCDSRFRRLNDYPIPVHDRAE